MGALAVGACKQRAATAAFGRRALALSDEDALHREAALAVAHGLPADLVEILELAPGAKGLRRRYGSGWSGEAFERRRARGRRLARAALARARVPSCVRRHSRARARRRFRAPPSSRRDGWDLLGDRAERESLGRAGGVHDVRPLVHARRPGIRRVDRDLARPRAPGERRPEGASRDRSEGPRAHRLEHHRDPGGGRDGKDRRGERDPPQDRGSRPRGARRRKPALGSADAARAPSGGRGRARRACPIGRHRTVRDGLGPSRRLPRSGAGVRRPDRRERERVDRVRPRPDIPKARRGRGAHSEYAISAVDIGHLGLRDLHARCRAAASRAGTPAPSD